MFSSTLLPRAPLTPDADEARSWAETELSKQTYNQGPSVWELIQRWLNDLLSGIRVNAQSPLFLLIVILGLLAVIAIIVVIVRSPAVRRLRHGDASSSNEIFGDDHRTSAAMRAAADAAAASGDFGTAVKERFRAIVRNLDERVILVDRDGRTAHEAAQAAASRLPTCADDLYAASAMFDAVCYGDRAATATDDQWLAQVDRQVRASKPTKVASAAAADVVLPR